MLKGFFPGVAAIALLLAIVGPGIAESPVFAQAVPFPSPSCGTAAWTPVPGAGVNSAPMAQELLHLEACAAQPLQLVNVMAYGAARDGATDDSGAWQAAINAASPCGSVYAPPGAYSYQSATDLQVPTGVQILAPNTTLIASGAASNGFEFTGSGKSCGPFQVARYTNIQYLPHLRNFPGESLMVDPSTGGTAVNIVAPVIDCGNQSGTQGDGIYLSATATTKIVSAVIQGALILGCQAAVHTVVDGSSALLQGVQVRYNFADKNTYGVWFDTTAGSPFTASNEFLNDFELGSIDCASLSNSDYVFGSTNIGLPAGGNSVSTPLFAGNCTNGVNLPGGGFVTNEHMSGRAFNPVAPPFYVGTTTVIGAVNTTATPPGAATGGFGANWNCDGGGSEVCLYNTYNGASGDVARGFKFFDLFNSTQTLEATIAENGIKPNPNSTIAAYAPDMLIAGVATPHPRMITFQCAVSGPNTACSFPHSFAFSNTSYTCQITIEGTVPYLVSYAQTSASQVTIYPSPAPTATADTQCTGVSP